MTASTACRFPAALTEVYTSTDVFSSTPTTQEKLWAQIFEHIPANRTALALVCKSFDRAKKASDEKIARTIASLPAVQEISRYILHSYTISNHKDAQAFIREISQFVKRRLFPTTPAKIARFGKSSNEIAHNPALLEFFLRSPLSIRTSPSLSPQRHPPIHASFIICESARTITTGKTPPKESESLT